MYSFKKENYSKFLIDYTPSYLTELLLEQNGKIIHDSSSSTQLKIPNYNSKLFCNKFPNYKDCSNISSQTPTALSFGMSLLSGIYDLSLLYMVSLDYPSININNGKYIGNINKNEIAPFIPDISYTFDTDSLSNNKYILRENNNLGNYDTILGIFKETTVENKFYEMLNTLNISIIDYVGNKNNTSDYIELKKTFINSSLDTKYGDVGDYLQGGDPDLLCLDQDEYGPNLTNIFAKDPFPSGTYYIKDLDSNLFLDSTINWDDLKTNSPLSSAISYFFIKHNNDNT